MELRMPVLVGVAAATIFATSAAAEASSLGPVDGKDLPPNELDRVEVGDEAPDFTLEDQQGEPVTLSELRGDRAVVLVFYRGRW